MTSVKVREDQQRHARHRAPTSTVKENSSRRTVKITGFKPGTKKDMIEMFVENKSGETELESCDCDEDTGATVVEFKNPQDNVILAPESFAEGFFNSFVVLDKERGLSVELD